MHHKGTVSKNIHQKRHYLVSVGKASYWCPYRKLNDTIQKAGLT